MIIAFDSGVVRHLDPRPTWPVKEQLEHRCASMAEGASLLNAQLKVVGLCDRQPDGSYLFVENEP